MALKVEHKATPYIVVDFETGGTDLVKEAIAEISMSAYRGDTLELIAEYDALIKPYGKEYNPKAIQVTGLTVDLLEREGKDFETVCAEVYAFLVKANVHNSKSGHKPVIVAHNGLFELKCFQHLQENDPNKKIKLDSLFGGQFDYYGNYIISVIDTLELAKFRYAHNHRQVKYTLEHVMGTAGIEVVDGHRARNDVNPTSTFFKQIIADLRQDGKSKQSDEGKVASFRDTFHFQIP